MRKIEVKLYPSQEVIEYISETEAIKRYGNLFDNDSNLLDKIVKLMNSRSSYYIYKIVESSL
jgi:hypothetical protein